MLLFCTYPFPDERDGLNMTRFGHGVYRARPAELVVYTKVHVDKLHRVIESGTLPRLGLNLMIVRRDMIAAVELGLRRAKDLMIAKDWSLSVDSFDHQTSLTLVPPSTDDPAIVLTLEERASARSPHEQHLFRFEFEQTHRGRLALHDMLRDLSRPESD